MPIKTSPHAITRQTFGSRLMGGPVPAVMSGSTSSGRGPNCETDVIGQEPTHAMQQKVCMDAKKSTCS
jgi:hypothetical protein